MSEITSEQKRAIESRGKVIVSASAGSGKTFVMIEKIVGEICGGADLDEILAVTFTKKAAAQMKDKLRSALIKAIETSPDKARIKQQLSKIPSADISTIHSLCARILRTYFYKVGIDGGFEIISDDDPVSGEIKERALDELFDGLYESNDGDLTHLLSRYLKKRSDGTLRRLILDCYSRVRTVARYGELLENSKNLYTLEGFTEIIAALDREAAAKYGALFNEVEDFERDFCPAEKGEVYAAIFSEMKEALSTAAEAGIFGKLPPLATTAKPPKRSGEESGDDIKFKAFRADMAKKYAAVRGNIADYETEKERFFESGRTAAAFSRLLMKFDGIYASIKRDENKLDYNDLEHLTLSVLSDGEVKEQLNARYKHVFVDEYQDVNPVQEEIISAIGGECFLVGDVKQAIYGFRGSKSLFFAEKYNAYAGGGGTALRLSDNFRSCKKVIDFVNVLFSMAMREETCGFDFANSSRMKSGAPYPEDAGGADILVFGKDPEMQEERRVYSVIADSRRTTHTREGLAVLRVVEEELKSDRYDPQKGGYVPVQPGDICILTRKNKGGSTEGIVRALKDAGYFVTGAKESSLSLSPAVKSILDILSLIDNAEQDVPMVSAMLSPVGGFSEDELAHIRLEFKKSSKKLAFFECCKRYCDLKRDGLAKKLGVFFERIEDLRAFAEVACADEIIYKILSFGGTEAALSAGDGSALDEVLSLSSAAHMPLSEFLARIASGGLNFPSPSPSSSDSIHIMSMHAAKGLEFPIVIVADICRSFKGQDYEEIVFDDRFGFAPRSFDTQNLGVYPTLLRKLIKIRSDREELVNELNLFYVACTRAQFRLHIMAQERSEFSPADALSAKCYAKTFDMAKLETKDYEPLQDFEPLRGAEVRLSAPADEEMFQSINSRFEREYSRADSVDLPVKSSASAILKARQGADEPLYAEKQLFPEDGETGAERGTAYHRFLELCDFSIKDAAGIEREIANFEKSGKILPSACALLNCEELEKIVNMPVFADLAGARLYREREFLCSLKACDVLDTRSGESVLVQGAIDLLAEGDFGVRIIDYKYSAKNDLALLEKYSPQLALYKKAVAAIEKIDEGGISAYIINIKSLRVIKV